MDIAIFYFQSVKDETQYVLVNKKIHPYMQLFKPPSFIDDQQQTILI